MAYRFDFSRFVSVENLRALGESDLVSYDFELSVSNDLAHVASCCCEACEPDSEPENIDYTDYGLNNFASPWLDFGALGSDHNHDHAAKDSSGPLFAGSADTIAGDSSTTATLAIDGISYGVRNSGTDQDWFQVDLVAGQEYTFFMLRTDVDGVSAHADPELFLFAPDGTTEVGTNDDTPSGGTNSRLTYTATETGTFYLAADGWNVSTGGYMVTASEGSDRVDFTTTQIADFLTDGFDLRSSWDQPIITYNMDSIPDGSAGDPINPDDGQPYNVQAIIIEALEAWAEVTGLVFQQVTGATAGDITFIDTEGGAYSSSSMSINGNVRTITSSTINVSQIDWIEQYGDEINSYSYQTYLHEIGHTLGLGHGGPYNGASTYGVDNAFTQDTWNHTVMSYHSQNEAGSGTSRLVLGLQVADLLAIHDLYGAAASTRGGNTVYGANSTEAGSIYDFDAWDTAGIRPPSFSIYDTGGIDTFDLSIYNTDQTISLIASEDLAVFSSVGDNGGTALVNLISIAVGTVIENAVGGGGNDTITGNDADNELEGNGGNDILDGGDGTDYAVYNGAQTNYTITDNGDGTWTVTGEGTDTLSNIEFARFTDGDVSLGSSAGTNLTEGDDDYSATPDDDIVNGLGGNDIINGLAGNDTLNGGEGDDILIGGAGSDLLDGGTGTDTASYEGSTNRVVINMATDSVTSGHATGDSFTSIESITGTQFNDTITGDGGANVISGGAGFDILSGFNGDDTIYGGSQNDFITGGTGADHIDGGAGDDFARYNTSSTAVNINLEAGTASGGDAQGDTLVNIERLFGSNHNDVLTGDANNNFLVGSAGDDTLDGSAGIDKLFGGTGADSFVFSAGDDFVYVTDWEDNLDSIDLSSYGFASVNDALANMDQRGDHVRFFDGDNTLLILNADIADIADDIVI